MTIDEAIEILTKERFAMVEGFSADTKRAVGLGIAGLVRIKTLRKENGAANFPLFGEVGDEALPIKEGE